MLVNSFKTKLGIAYQLSSYDCPACLSNKFTDVAKSKEGFRWEICTCCGLLQLHTRLSGDDLNSFYETGEYHQVCMGGLNDQDHFDLERYLMSIPLEYCLYKVLGDIKNKSILEIGCGSGGILYSLKNDGMLVKGYDLDPDRIAYGQKYISEIFLGDAMEVLGRDNYDVLMLSNVLEHLHAPDAFLVELRKHVKGNELIIIDVPNIDGCAQYGVKFTDFLHIGHLWYFSPVTLERLLNSTGFSVKYVLNRGAAMTIVCMPSDVIKNDNNAHLNVISSINFANYKSNNKLQNYIDDVIHNKLNKD
jgi:SAM-dependent methyltransferase